MSLLPMLFSRAIDAFFASRVKESGSNLNAQRNVAAALPMLQDLSVLCHNITRYMKVSVIQHSDVSSATYLQRISPETSCRSHPNQRRLYKIFSGKQAVRSVFNLESRQHHRTYEPFKSSLRVSESQSSTLNTSMFSAQMKRIINLHYKRA